MSAILTGALQALARDGAHLVGTWVAALLTLAVLSYIVGYNGVFRLAEHLFVGIAAGYAAAVAWNSVLWPRLLVLWQEPAAHWHYGLFFALGLLLLSRSLPRFSALANLPLAALIGGGAGLALGGALLGTLLPQTRAAIVSVSPERYGGGLAGWGAALSALLLALCTVAVLAMFTYQRGGPGRLGRLGHHLLRLADGLGRQVVMITFGALLAGAAVTFFSLLQSRLAFLIYDWLGLLSRAP